MGPTSSAFAPPRSVPLAAAAAIGRTQQTSSHFALLSRPALLAVAVLAAACSQEGRTPTCEPNVTKDGVGIRNSEGQLFVEQDPDDYTKQPCTAFGRCFVGGDRVSAIHCCCPTLDFVNQETGKLVEHKVQNGQCVNQETGDIIPADRYDLMQCRYGFGEVEIDTSGGAGAAGGSGGNGGNGGSGGSGGS